MSLSARLQSVFIIVIYSHLAGAWISVRPVSADSVLYWEQWSCIYAERSLSEGFNFVLNDVEKQSAFDLLLS